MDKVKTVAQDMKNTKSAVGEVPIQILKESEFTLNNNYINKSIETGCLPDSLKEANTTPIFKKDDPLDKSSYRPISIPPFTTNYKTVRKINL